MKPEEAEQIALIDWAEHFDDVRPYLMAIRNEGKRSYSEGNRAKRMGMRRGAADLFFARPFNNIPGLWIELKAPKTRFRAAGKPTKEQLSFQELMRQTGYKSEICWGWPDAANTICEYLGKKKAFVSKNLYDE